MIRALRRRRSWRQQDLADKADLSQSLIARVEAGHLDTISLRALRSVTAALDMRLDLQARWRGGDLDRLVDARHAGVSARATEFCAACGWSVHQEVKYAYYSERGSIDLLGLKPAAAAAAVMEVKSEITSWEETQRKFDEKVRLLPRIVFERFGWRPRTIGKILVLDDAMTNRRRVAALGAAATQAYPARTREVRSWLREPSDSQCAGIWFLSPRTAGGTSERGGGPHRVRRPPEPPKT